MLSSLPGRTLRTEADSKHVVPETIILHKSLTALPRLNKLIIDWQLFLEETDNHLMHSELMDGGHGTRDHPLSELALRVGKPRVSGHLRGRIDFDPCWREEMQAILDHLAVLNLQTLVLGVAVDDDLLENSESWEDFEVNLQAVWRYPTVRELRLEIEYKVGETLEMECCWVSGLCDAV